MYSNEKQKEVKKEIDFQLVPNLIGQLVQRTVLSLDVLCELNGV